VNSITDGQQGPESVDPRVLAGYFSQEEAQCSDDETPHEGVLHASDTAVVVELKGR